MEGWLKKKGENLGAYFWKDRWFKEEDGKLVYYTNPSMTAVKGHIEIKAIKDPRLDNFNSSSGAGFEIVIEGRTYCLLAAKEAEQLAWVNSLLARISKKQKFVVTGEEWIQSLKSVARSAVVTIVNLTPYVLERENFKLHRAGQEWKKFPPERLNPNESCVLGSCSSTLLTGTSASVTFRTRIDLDEVIVWLRWANPFSKIFASKKALYEASSRIRIKASVDVSEGSRFIADSDIYRIKYEISFDPMLDHSEDIKIISGGINGANINLSDSGDGAERDWIDLEKDRDGPQMKPVEDGKLGQIMTTSFGETKYYADWIPVLKSAARSVLITIINETPYSCDRTDWSLNRGLWRAIPSEHIKSHQHAQFGTASHGLLGFRSGTIGSVTYFLKIQNGNYIITFSWKNHLMWGISNAVSVTSTVASEQISLPPITVLTESNNDAAYEITFSITDASSPITPRANGPTPVSSPKSQAASSSSNDQQIAIAKKVVRKTIVRRIQEEGVKLNLTDQFSAMRKHNLEERNATLMRIEMDLEIVSHALLQRARQRQERSSLFDTLFSKELTLGEQAECVAPTRIAASTLTTSVCPITKQALSSKDEMRYCLICGRIVHRSVVVIVPFPPSCDTTDLKKPPPGVQTCLDCNATLAQAERTITRRAQVGAASKHPVHALHDGLWRNRLLIKTALQDLRRMISVKDKDAILVVQKIRSLLRDIDSLQMALFALNEESPRMEQKLNNSLALFVSDWKEEIEPELEALQQAI